MDLIYTIKPEKTMNEKPKLYVYLITNILLNKQYVGSHTCYNENDGYMGSSKHLNNDYKIYGKENFIKEIINDSYENKNDLLEGETKYILKYNTLSPNGYNRFLPNNNKGFHFDGCTHSKETREKLSKSLKGKMKGRIFQEISKQKMSKAAKLKIGDKNGMFGKIHTEESKLQNRLSNLGKSHKKYTLSTDTKDKMSKSKQGKIPWNKGLKIK